MLRPRRTPPTVAATLLLALAAVACAALLPSTSAAHPGPHGDAGDRQTAHDLRRARHATRAFRDVASARAAGYTCCTRPRSSSSPPGPAAAPCAA